MFEYLQYAFMPATILELNSFLPGQIYVDIQLQWKQNTFDFQSFASKVPFFSLEMISEMQICKLESGKPYILVDQRMYGFSISHTSDVYLVGANETGEIGVDIELIGRKIHPGLRKRIESSEDQWIHPVDTLQVWTIKEAVLKLIGTGLRTNMNQVVVQQIDKINFSVSHDNKQISIVSLSTDGYWISIAWTHTN